MQFRRGDFAQTVLSALEETETAMSRLVRELNAAYDLVVIDESHNFRNNDAFKDQWGGELHTPETWLQGRTYFAPGYEPDATAADAGPATSFYARRTRSGGRRTRWAF